MFTLFLLTGEPELKKSFGASNDRMLRIVSSRSYDIVRRLILDGTWLQLANHSSLII